MTKNEFDSKHPNKMLSWDQVKFLQHILFYHEGLGHPLGIIRILESNTYHAKKDAMILNRLKRSYLLMTVGKAKDLEKEYGKVTSENKYDTNKVLTQRQVEMSTKTFKEPILGLLDKSSKTIDYEE